MLTHLLRLGQCGIPSLFVLVIMVSVGPFGDTEYAPSLPAIAQDFGVRYELTQLTMTVYLAGYGLFQLIYGPLSDRFGRKPIVLMGAGFLILGSTLCLLSSNIMELMIARFIQAIGAAAGSIIGYAAIRDAYAIPEQKHVFAKVNAIFALAPALGPIVGALIDDFFGWRMNFLLLVVLSVGMFLSLLFFFPETKRECVPDAIQPKRLLFHYSELFKDRYYWVYAVIMGLCVGVVYCALIGSPPLIINVLHLPSRWFAVIALGVMLGFVTGSLLCNWLGRTVSDAKLMTIGLGMMLITSGIFAGLAWLGYKATHLWPLLVPIIIVFMGIAFVLPITSANALAPFARLSGYASAMMGFIQMSIASLATAILGRLPAMDFFTLPVMFVGLSVLALLLHGIFIVTRSCA